MKNIAQHERDTIADGAVTVSWRGCERGGVTSEPVTSMNFPFARIFGAAAEGDANLLAAGDAASF